MIFHLNTLYVDIKQTMYAGNKSYNYDLNTLYVDIKLKKFRYIISILQLI